MDSEGKETNLVQRAINRSSGITIIVVAAGVFGVGYTAGGTFKENSVRELKVELVSKKAEYDAKLASAEANIAAIDRRLLDRSARILDVASIPFDAREVPSLPRDYRQVGNSGIYVNVGTEKDWEVSEITELDVHAMGLLGPFFAMMTPWWNEAKVNAPKLKAVPGASEETNRKIIEAQITVQMYDSVVQFKKQKKAYGWKNKNGLIFRIAAMSGLPPIEFVAYPYVTVEKVDETYPRDLVAAYVAPAKKMAASVPIIDAWMDNLQNSFNQIAPQTLTFSFVDLERMLTLVIPQLKSEIYAQQLTSNSSHYDTELIFSSARVQRNSYLNCTDQSDQVFIRRESLYVTAGKSAYFVQAQVPSCDRRGGSFAWTSRFLNGLRILRQ